MQDIAAYIQALDWEPAIQVMLAALLGAIVGLERGAGGHPAGLRTNTLIAISSCAFTILSIQGFPLQGAAQDTARVAAQVVTGVGFLGAGALLQAKGHVRGLTTAASIWLVAAIGMAVGAGLYFLAIFTTLLSALLLVLLAPLSRRLDAQSRSTFGSDEKLKRDGEADEPRNGDSSRFLD